MRVKVLFTPSSLAHYSIVPTQLNLIGANRAAQWNENIISLELTICAIRKPVNSIVQLASNIEDCNADYRIKRNPNLILMAKGTIW